ncbi:MAG: MmcQ/YjbR family DNA-binding protein [Pseudomonadota bacterium]
MSVSMDEIHTICAVLPGATRAHPPELISWKVGGKMFACFGMQDNRDGVSVKCPDVETATMLIDAGTAARAKYFHRSWVRLHFDATSESEARHRIGVSYDTVRAGLPKSVRTSLPDREVS